MAGLADIQADPKFQALSPEAKGIVFDQLSSQDQGFSALSPDARMIVKQKLLGNVGGQPSAEAPTSSEPSMGDFLLDRFKRGMSGLASMATIPTGLVTAPVRGVAGLLGGLSPAQSWEYAKSGINMGGQVASKALDVKNLPVPKDEYGNESLPNKYLGNIAEFAGAGFIPGLGVVGGAERKLLAAMVELGGTTLSGLSATEGGELGRDMAKKFGVDPATGEHIGTFVGSFFGPGALALAAKGIAKGTGAVGSKVSEATGLTGPSAESQLRAARLAANKQFSESLTAAPETAADVGKVSPAFQQNIEQAGNLEKSIPGFQPTLGQASGAPGVIAIEQQMAGKSAGNLAQAAQRQGQNIEAIGNEFNRAFPGSEVSPTAGTQKILRGRAAMLNQRLNSTQDEIQALANLPSANNVAIGARLRELRDQAQNAARATKNQLYKDVYDAADAAGVKAPVDDVQTLMRQVAGSDENAAQIMPRLYGDLRSAMTKYKPGEGLVGPEGAALGNTPQTEVPFAALHSMLKRSNEDLAAAQMAQNPTAAYLVGQVRSALQKKVSAFESPEYGNVADKLATANQFFAQKYAPLFYEGLGGQMARFNRFGDVTPDEQIVRKLIFAPGDKQSGISDFVQLYGGNPEATKLLEDGVLDMFTRAAVRDGEIKPQLAETFMRSHQAQLGMMPKIKATLSNLDSANDALLLRRAQVQQQQKMLDQTFVAKIAQSDDPQKVINQALGDRRTLQALIAGAKQVPGGEQSVARAIAEGVAAQKDPYAFLQANAPMLRRELEKLGPGHFDNLLKLAQAAEVMGRVSIPGHVTLSHIQDIGEQAIGTPVKGLFSRALNVAKGYMSKGYAVLDVGGRYVYKIKQAEMDRLMQEAIYDPDVAKSLVRFNQAATPVEKQAAITDLQRHAWSHGIRVLSVERSREQGSQ